VTSKAFAITGSKGFHMKFSNGWKISVQWGPASYGDNYSAPYRPIPDPCESNLAEVAVFKPDGSWASINGSDVAAYITADEVGKLIAQLVEGKFP
jgi:hypothetical protein